MNKDQKPNVVKMLMSLWVLYHSANFLINWETASFSKVNPPNGISQTTLYFLYCLSQRALLCNFDSPEFYNQVFTVGLLGLQVMSLQCRGHRTFL